LIQLSTPRQAADFLDQPVLAGLELKEERLAVSEELPGMLEFVAEKPSRPGR
jgi:hypothetical protein